MNDDIILPSDVQKKEVLNLIMLVDESCRMLQSGRKVYNALNSLKSKLIKIQNDNFVEIYVRAITFNDKCAWSIGNAEKGVSLKNLTWPRLNPEGDSKTHLAIDAASQALRVKNIGTRGLRPVVILITTGQHDSTAAEYEQSIDKIKRCLTGRKETEKISADEEKVTRVAIGIGKKINREQLKQFASEGELRHSASNGKSPEKKPLVFFAEDDLDQISKCIVWTASTSLIASREKKAIVIYTSEMLRNDGIKGWDS